jgi:hypothetical protein
MEPTIPKIDKNTKYEDEHVIVFLATDPTSPKQTVKNCNFYGKGLSICISESSSKSFCYKDRWTHKLTTYFVWLKQKKKFILVDRKKNGEYQYNNITKELSNSIIGTDNYDNSATEKELLEKFPILETAIKQNAFAYIPLQKLELDFYEKIYYAKNILELKTLEDRLEYVAMLQKSVSDEDWDLLPEKQRHRIFKEYIQATPIRNLDTRDISENVLNKFPTLKNRYWNKVENNAKYSLILGNPLSAHEKFLLSYQPELFLNISSKEFLSKKERAASRLYNFLKNLIGAKLTFKILNLLNLKSHYETKTKKLRGYLQHKIQTRLGIQDSN